MVGMRQYRNRIARGVLRLYRACITSVSALYHACIVRGGVLRVYQCVSVCISVLPSPWYILPWQTRAKYMYHVVLRAYYARINASSV